MGSGSGPPASPGSSPGHVPPRLVTDVERMYVTRGLKLTASFLLTSHGRRPSSAAQSNFTGNPSATRVAGPSVAIPAMMADVEEVEVVVAHTERATLRVGDVFLKIDADQTRTEIEVEAMAMAPVPTPEILWRKPPVLALAALPGTALGRLGQPSRASSAAWAAAGAAVRTLHDAPLPPWPGRSIDELASRLADECEWLVANEVLPAERGHTQPLAR